MCTETAPGSASTVTIPLTHGLRAWFVRHAEELGLTVEATVQMAVEVYADSMRVQRRRDDADYDRMGVPRQDRHY